MKKSTIKFALLALLFSEPVFAIHCTSVSTLEAVAQASKAVESPVHHVCRLEGESALHLSGTLSSSLVRARGYVEVLFQDIQGKPFPPVRRGPWMGGFSGLTLDDAVAVPLGAVNVQVIAKAESEHRAAAGRWRITDLAISQGIVVSGDPLNGTVITTRQSALWQFSTVPVSVQGEFIMTLRNLDGKVLASRRLQRVDSKTYIDFGNLPIGYYEVSTQFSSMTGTSNVWTSSLVVLPEDIPPNEPRFGMDAGLSWYGGTSEMIERSAKMLRRAGVGTVRDRLSWSKIQSVRGSLDWGHYVQVAKIVEKAGLEQVQVFAGAPAWAYKGIPIQGRQPPLDDNALFEFGQEYAKGLGKTVRNVEFWNEPNLPQFYKGRPYQYANAMKAFYSGIKSVDSDIRVLIGSVANMPGRFFEETYKNNAGKFFDTRNWHYYLDEDMDHYIAGNLSSIEDAGKVSDKPGWLTERGYSLRRDPQGDWKSADLKQAAFLVKTYVEGFANGYERVFFFFWPELIESDHYTWGVLRDDLSPRPAYFALSMLTRHLAGAEPEAIEKNGSEQRFFFRKSDGTRVAVMWGDRLSQSSFVTGLDVSDIFGNKLDVASINMRYSMPLVVTNITRLPPGATPIKISTAEAVRGEIPMRLSGFLKVNGKPYFADDNQATISISDGAELEISGHVYPKNATETSLECTPGKGLSLLSSAPTRSFSEDGSYSCHFIAKLSGVGESYAEVHAKREKQNDFIRIALVPDVMSVAAANVGYPLKPGDSCPIWVSRHSANLTVKLDSRNLSTFCRLHVTSHMDKPGDVWVFPALQISNNEQLGLDGAIGLRVNISEISGNPFPSGPFLLQMVEKSGGIWLIDLVPDKTGKIYTGLFDLAYMASWKKDDNGKLDLKNLREIMFGWAGSRETMGQQRGFTIEGIDVLPKHP